jgi:hypothetical protein
MVFWFEIDLDQITATTVGTRQRFSYKGGPLRFQIPRGTSQGLSEFKSMYVNLTHEDFIQWWRQLEGQLCPQTPFNSNLKGTSLRLKIDDSVYVFDANSKQINPEIREGLFRGQDVSCLIDVDSTYFFNGNWGLTVRIYQIKTLTDAPTFVETPSEDSSRESFSLPKGTCAFLPEE